MRQTSFTILLCIIAHTLFSQQGPLLQKFKFRISNYRAINFSFSGTGQSDRNLLGAGVNKNSSSSGNLGAGYYSIKSTERILLTTSANLSSDYSTNKTNGGNVLNSGKSFSVSPSYHVLNKWFSKNMFTELGADASSYINTYNYASNSYPGPSKNNQSYYSVAANTGIGKGRLENISDMQNALWLYKELEAAKILSRPLSDDELIELGKSITKGNNTRVLDLRRRTQFILKTVDNYFQQKDLISKTDIDYFVRLNDILFFAINNQRLAGTEKFIRFTPAISGGSQDAMSNYTFKYEQRYSAQSLVLTSGFNKYIPLSLVHQNNYGAAVKLAYISKLIKDRYFNSGSPTSEINSNQILRQAGVSAFYQHAIYPNTRTIISFNILSEGGYQSMENESNFYGALTLSGALNYFISYRTRLTGNVGAVLQKNLYYNNQYNNLYYNYHPEYILLYANVGLEISL